MHIEYKNRKSTPHIWILYTKYYINKTVTLKNKIAIYIFQPLYETRIQAIFMQEYRPLIIKYPCLKLEF